MAQIDNKNFEKIEKNRNTVHEAVYSTYTFFESGGKKYFQIDTYGKKDRENPCKCSQSIQVNKETAQSLIELMKKGFDLQ